MYGDKFGEFVCGYLLTSFNKHFCKLAFLLLLDTKPIDIQGLLIDLLKTEKHVHFQAQTHLEKGMWFSSQRPFVGKSIA